ncbi:hypothetical protein ACFL41_01825 [Gemmatimonadota bacterium]
MHKTGLFSPGKATRNAITRTGVILPLIILYLFCQVSAINAQEFVVYPPAENSDPFTGKVINLIVPLTGNIPLIVAPADGTPDTIDISLSSFTDKAGGLIVVNLIIPKDTLRSGDTIQQGVSIGDATYPIILEVPLLPRPDEYTGYLYFSSEKNILDSYQISLKRASLTSAATLVLDQQSIELSYTKPFPFGGGGPSFTLHLREESNEWPLDGIYVRLVEANATNQKYDPKQSLSFEWNGRPISDFWNWPPNDSTDAAIRSIPRGGQASLRGELNNVRAGEYTTKLQFHALNSQLGEAQDLNLVIKVRHSWGWALIALSLAIAFSFLSIKGLGARRQRLSLRRQVLDLRPDWLRREDAVLPVVWVKAMLKQAEDLSSKWMLSGIDVINDRLARATQTLTVLYKIRRIRRLFEASGLHRWVGLRVEKHLRTISNSIGQGHIDDKMAAEIDAELANLELLLNPNEFVELYKKDLKRDISRLFSSIEPEGIEEEIEQNVVKELIREIDNSDPQSYEDLIKYERNYDKLKLIWERRGYPKLLTELCQLYKKGKPVESFFDVADGAAWKLLEEAEDTSRLHLKGPLASPELFEPYKPMTFKVDPDDPVLRDTFLFNQLLEFKWSFKLTPPDSRRRLKKRYPDGLPLNPISREPSVIQYFPWPGTLTASVEIQYEDKGDIKLELQEELQIGKSRDFHIQRAFEAVELGALGMAWIVASITGLTTLYFTNSVFGSAQDYIGLFLWGIGADATKIFLQNLGRSSTSTIAGSPGDGG